MRGGNARQRRGQRSRQRARAPHVDIEAGVGRGDLDVQRLLGGQEHFGNRPCSLQCVVETFGQNRATIDRDHVVRAGGGKADLENVMAAAPGVEHGAAAAGTMGVDQVADRRLDPRLAQRRHDEVALPRAIKFGLPMLHGAAAADAKMRTNRRDAFAARRVDAEQLPPVGVAGNVLDLDRLAGQRPEHENRLRTALDDAVAAMADAIDHEALNHARPR